MKNLDRADVRWLFSLGAKFARVVPLRTFSVVLLTLLSQISSLVAFLLPLKIVILLGSEGMPRYFPSVFSTLDRDLLVLYLSAATLGFFFTYIFAEKLIERITGGATHALISRSHKIVLFENQEEVASGAYKSFSRALAGVIFSFFAVIVLAIFYPEMAAVFVVYTILTSAGTIIVCGKSETFLGKFEDDPSGLMRLLSSVGFFVVFGYLIVDFIWLTPPSLIVAIVAILLGRQAFNRLTGAVVGLMKLIGQQRKLDALFFHGKVLLPASQSIEKTIWSYLAPANRVSWVGDLLKEHVAGQRLPSERLVNNLSWLQPALNGMGMLKFPDGDNIYVVKLYGDKMSSLALHESTLLSETPTGLPAPEWLGVTEVGGFRCSLYCLPCGKFENGSDARIVELRKQLLAVEPNADIAQRYMRSKPTLPHRIDPHCLDLLEIAVSTDEQERALNKLRNSWQLILQALLNLPLSYFIPSMSSQSVWMSKSASPVLLHWERWSVEPVGAGWSTDDKRIFKLYDAVSEVSGSRPELKRIPKEHLALSALMSELDRLIQKKNLRSAAKLLPRMASFLTD